MSDTLSAVASLSSLSAGSESQASLLHHDEQKMRSKFFQMIGIEAAPPSQQQQATVVSNTSAKTAAAPSASPEIPPASWLQSTFSSREGLAASASSNNSNLMSSSAQRLTPVLVEALKYDKLADAAAAQPSSQTKRKRIRKRVIDFNETVQVIPIPMRNEYSNRVKSRLWAGAMEIHQNAARNTVEFASEGWDWRSVAEDDRMYVCVATGEMIHPCHYEAYFKATRNGAQETQRLQTNSASN